MFFPRAVLIAAAACGVAAQTPERPTRILALGDSITMGCGSSSALPPQWSGSCGNGVPGGGGYRAPLYHMLKDTGFVFPDTKNASFTFVGPYLAGPDDIPLNQTAHQGAKGWTINMIAGGVAAAVLLEPDFILLHAGTNDIGKGRTPPQMLADLTSLLRAVAKGAPNATTIVATIINFNYTEFNPPYIGEFNAALPALVANLSAAGQRVRLADVNRRSGWCQDPGAGFAMCLGVHPSLIGYYGMAMAWAEVLAPILPCPPKTAKCGYAAAPRNDRAWLAAA